jgi:hypothetical protein
MPPFLVSSAWTKLPPLSLSIKLNGALTAMQMVELRRITDVPVTCKLCDWQGVTGECLPDDDGKLLCGRCASYDIEIHQLPHELDPHSSGANNG